MKSYNVMLAGVGGQGILFAARVLGTAALKESYDVKISEVHGMAQRGGSVVTHARLGRKVYAPVVEKGRCDLLIAFEELEALRWADYLKKDGRVIINQQQIAPMPVITGKAEYPRGIPAEIRGRGGDVLVVDALATAEKCGNPRAVNMVLLGLAAPYLPLKEETWLEAITEVTPPRFAAVNVQAFREGYQAGSR